MLHGNGLIFTLVASFVLAFVFGMISNRRDRVGAASF